MYRQMTDEEMLKEVDDRIHAHKEKTKVILEQMQLVFEVQEKAIKDLQEQNKLLNERLNVLDSENTIKRAKDAYFDNVSETDGLGQKGDKF